MATLRQTLYVQFRVNTSFWFNLPDMDSHLHLAVSYPNMFHVADNVGKGGSRSDE